MYLFHWHMNSVDLIFDGKFFNNVQCILVYYSIIYGGFTFAYFDSSRIALKIPTPNFLHHSFLRSILHLSNFFFFTNPLFRPPFYHLFYFPLLTTLYPVFLFSYHLNNILYIPFFMVYLYFYLESLFDLFVNIYPSLPSYNVSHKHTILYPAIKIEKPRVPFLLYQLQSSQIFLYNGNVSSSPSLRCH